MKLDRKKIKKLLPKYIKLRHLIHRFPELSYQEKQTSSLIAQTLTTIGYSPMTGIAKTGVTAILDSGKPGKTLALRADMDALPILETTHLEYRSEIPGVMHACGHDGHVATLLLVANILRDYQDQFKGKIKFIFQPAEENGHGADAMIKAGVLTDPPVDVIFGYHNVPGFPKNKVIIRSHCILAGGVFFSIKVQGRGGHSSAPEKTIDPIYPASIIVQSLQRIVSQAISPFEHTVISVTNFHAGEASNVIPDSALLKGTIRFTNLDTFQYIKNQIKLIAVQTAKAFGATVKIKYDPMVPPTINSISETNFVKEIANDLFDNHVLELENNLMATEDFAFYLNKVPGCFFLIGSGTDLPYLHTQQFQFNDEIIPTAAELLATLALRYLNTNF